MPRIQKESDILNEDTRKLIIDEIKGPENQTRKDEAFKRYEIFKDQTKYYVRAQLEKQFDPTTVNEMSYALANISLARKAIEKLSKVYANGTVRKLDGVTTVEQSTTQTGVDDMAKALDFDTQMKKANQFLKLQRNILVYPKPCPEEQSDGSVKFRIKLDILNPYLYDVIEDYYDRERPMIVILSDYKKSSGIKYTTGDAASVDRGPATAGAQGTKPTSDGKDQKIADSPEDAKLSDQEEFIWWSKNFHFTTNAKGEVITKPNNDGKNPILTLPFVSFNIGQDGQYWAKGGDDLIDGSVLVNSMITNVLHVGVQQGYGQMWMRGKNLPVAVKVGPTHIIKMEYENEEDPEPQLGFASASPQLQELQRLVEMYVALLLTTNNLSTKGVSTNLDKGMDFPSGLAMMIDGSESTEDISEQRKIFIDKEPKIWTVIQAWQDVYGTAKILAPPFDLIKLPKGNVSTSFNDQNMLMTESDKLDNIKKRSDLGINTELELIMKDRPELTKEQAQEKLKEILAEKIKRQAEAIQNAADMANADPSNQNPGAPNEGGQGAGEPNQNQY